MMEWLPLIMFICVCLCLMAGYPVAFTLAGASLLFAGLGVMFDWFNPLLLNATFNRTFGVMTNQVLVAVPLFVFMGVMLQRSHIAENLLGSMAKLMGNLRGGLAISVIIVGALLAASTGIVGATVVTMGMLSLPAMLKRGYDPALSTGTICASGTLGQIIPPSIVLILLGEAISSAYRSSYGGDPVNVGDLFIGALIPGILLVSLYILYVFGRALINPEVAPEAPPEEQAGSGNLFKEVIQSLVLPLLLIFVVLGSILMGWATPTEASAIGAVGALILALTQKQLSWPVLKDVMISTTKTSSMVFMILIGASIFSLVFRALGGDEAVQSFLQQMPGGVTGAMIIIMLVMFLLGFILDFIEIIYVVVPIVAPVLLQMGVDPIWLGIMIAINLQASFLTPPFGFALFYLRGVAPESVATKSIYRGAIPFIIIQLMVLLILAAFPELATWLPKYLAE
ncbi:TRAP transporter large permease subunit [Pleionea sp. CnH1-48]|uniref:TRAP transporter large permease n=1 Tax=Pleionea sp. CnH1-48 TaxID=2954494 RepID=UPI0020971B96|nr:TRAP transporter large permease subunit [Pleionea sp. CnH1-48]MCO7227111.1 TRAP transporter large permease subunit [Pleionea sp. CnH1-48]